MSALLFIYNAKSGIANTLIDISHKLLSPETYSCNLCAITHNTFSENKTWKDYRLTCKINMQFYHIDEFKQRFPNQEFKYPIILLNKENKLEEFISSKKINTLKNVEDLINAINNKLSVLAKSNSVEID
jgi:hypothetical protein